MVGEGRRGIKDGGVVGRGMRMTLGWSSDEEGEEDNKGKGEDSEEEGKRGRRRE